MALRSSASAVLLGALMPSSASAECYCIYQDHILPVELYTLYPSNDPGAYKDLVAEGRYGSMCAAWDQLPGTPWAEASCTGENATKNSWCKAPWCYVDSDCPNAERTQVFQGSTTAFYSYEVCGAPDCYNAGIEPEEPIEGCPYGTVYDSTCPCKFATDVLSPELLENYPVGEAGKFKNFRGMKYYGTTCAAWDQQPDTPYFDSCPEGSDWCLDDYNWCQAPWCYVDEASCPMMKGLSSMFNGSNVTPALHWSYHTCGSVDCSNEFSDLCPWDGTSNGWWTEVPYECELDDESRAASALAWSSAITASVIMILMA